MSIRKTGLWITYVLYDKTIVTEWYAGEAIDDDSWKNLSNWRDGTNSLVGDISISSDGYWVVNGVITTIKAQGEQGITPMLRVGSNNHLQASYTNGSSWVDVSTNPVYTQFRINNNKLEQSVDLGQTWTVVSDYIASWFRFTGTTGSSQADNVGRGRYNSNNPNSDETNSNGNYLSDFSKAIKEICSFYSIPVLDLGSISQLDFMNSEISAKYSSDNLHPNCAGHKLIGELLFRFVEDNVVII